MTAFMSCDNLTSQGQDPYVDELDAMTRAGGDDENKDPDWCKKFGHSYGVSNYCLDCGEARSAEPTDPGDPNGPQPDKPGGPPDSNIPDIGRFYFTGDNLTYSAKDNSYLTTIAVGGSKIIYMCLIDMAWDGTSDDYWSIVIGNLDCWAKVGIGDPSSGEEDAGSVEDDDGSTEPVGFTPLPGYTYFTSSYSGGFGGVIPIHIYWPDDSNEEDKQGAVLLSVRCRFLSYAGHSLIEYDKSYSVTLIREP